MQIVIDISDRKYKWIVDNPQTYTDYLDEAIRNGTPRPKGHGRLIDADALKNEWKNGFHKKIVDALMDDAPTIIEADKTESEDRMSKETTCKNCRYASECIMYEPTMRRCKDYKESEE